MILTFFKLKTKQKNVLQDTNFLWNKIILFNKEMLSNIVLQS